MKPKLDTRPAIKTIEDVVREHVETVVETYPDEPQYKLAVALGWSPSTLCRRLAEWRGENGETLVRDRR